ncbi:MAG: lamin tail domain-containing protein [Tannerellaceae bacterium]|nr:lamin tail domain-containing protein [Tannerellaceae bacterium]
MKQIMLLLWAFCPLYVFSQLSENFTGSEVTSQNPWQGNLNHFFINAEQQLQFTSPENEADEKSIYLPLNYTENMTWDFTIKLDFPSSNQNYMRLYVYSTGENNQLAAYFIQVGTNNKQVIFYSSENNKQSPLISGRQGLLDEPYAFIHIRLTLEENKTWKLYTRKTGETEYYHEGSYSKELKTIRPGGLLNIWCKYVKARVSTYYIDQIHVHPYLAEFPETDENTEKPVSPDPPELIEIEIPSLSELTFIFDKPVDISEATFHISEIGSAISRHYGITRSIIHTTYSSEMKVDHEYTISWKNLKDEKGNKLKDDFWDIMLEKDENEEEKPPGAENPYPPYPVKSVLINEVMADPKGLTELPETEYVELYNTTAQRIPLKNWQFIYDGKVTLLEDIQLPAKGYVVLYREGRDIWVDPEGIAMPLSKFPAALANNGKHLQLKDPEENLIDEISYLKAKPGIAWERAGDEFYLSTDLGGGTPGKENSPPEGGTNDKDKPSLIPLLQEKDLIFNELLPEPFDGGEEYIELYNRSGKEIYLEDLYIIKRKNDGEFGTFYSLANIKDSVGPEGYIALTSGKEKVTLFYPLAPEEAVHEVKLPILANTTSNLVLFQGKDSLIIDEITYSSKWHASSIKNKKGVALERIDPDGETQDPENWTSAATLSGYDCFK